MRDEKGEGFNSWDALFIDPLLIVTTRPPLLHRMLEAGDDIQFREPASLVYGLDASEVRRGGV